MQNAAKCNEHQATCKENQTNKLRESVKICKQLQTPEEIKLSLTGLWFRMNDKIQRLKTLLMGNKESAVDEPLEDAYLDVSNYGIMATIVKNGKWGK